MILLRRRGGVEKLEFRDHEDAEVLGRRTLELLDGAVLLWRANRPAVSARHDCGGNCTR